LGATLLTVGIFVACGSPDGRAEEPSRTGPEASSSMDMGNQERLPPPGEAWVIFGDDTVHAEIARTSEERGRGLMYRDDLPPGRGMLFVFSDSAVRSFWMSNTYIPLDIAYLDENLRIVDIQAMEPETTDPHPSALPAMFALEVPLGWFDERGIEVGAEARVVFGPG
jgi:uncharacterized membrane protein (UPF0127 family)